MKVCPQCEFANEECFPTCVFCNALIVDVASRPHENPTHPEHERTRLLKIRHGLLLRQKCVAGALYCGLISATAAASGLLFSTVLTFGSGALCVAILVARQNVGQFSATLLQAALSLSCLMFSGQLNPLIFFALSAQIFLASTLGLWMESIESSHR